MKFSKSALSLSTLTLCSGLIWTSHPVPLQSSPLVSLGERGALFFNGSAGATYDDNIFLDSRATTDDFRFNVSPGLEYSFSDDATLNLSVLARQDFFFYADNSDLDYTASSISARGVYRDEIFQGSVQGAFFQTRQNTPDTNVPGRQIRQEIISFDVDGEYRLSDVFSVASGLGITDRSFKERDFRDQTTYTVPVDIFYRMTPILDLSGGYRLRYIDNSNPLTGDSLDHFFNLGVRGEIATNLNGRIFGGYQIREFDEISSVDGFSFGTQLAYQISPLMKANLTLERDFRVGGRGDTIELTGGRLGLHYQATDFLRLNGGLSYYNYDYKEGGSAGRDDDYLTLSLGGSYLINQYSQVGLTYNLRDNDSNRELASFTNNTVTVSASFRY